MSIRYRPANRYLLPWLWEREQMHLQARKQVTKEQMHSSSMYSYNQPNKMMLHTTSLSKLFSQAHLVTLGMIGCRANLEPWWPDCVGPKKLVWARASGRVWFTLLLVQYETMSCLVACMHQSLNVWHMGPCTMHESSIPTCEGRPNREDWSVRDTGERNERKQVEPRLISTSYQP